mgnify:FL=1
MRVTKHRVAARVDDVDDEENKDGFNEDITVPLTISMALLVGKRFIQLSETAFSTNHNV